MIILNLFGYKTDDYEENHYMVCGKDFICLHLMEKVIMSIESEIFKRGKIDFGRLVVYGFVKKNDFYCYQKNLIKNFQVTIFVDMKGNVSGKIYDLRMDEEYTNYRIEDLTGFAHQVREEYILILKDIAHHVLIVNDFIYDQANRIAYLIQNKYQVTPEFLWDKFPHYGVFRNKKSGKWFAAILNVDKSKIIHNLSGEVEILNVKLDHYLNQYVNKDGIYPAYHMSKKSWVSIILDDTLSDEEIMLLVDLSYSFANFINSWIIPANPKYYDIISLFQHTNFVTWHQDVKVSVGDLVYIYLTIPYQAIMYQCEVVEADISSQYSKNMRLKLLREYDQKEFSLEKLKQFGLKSVRSARRVPVKLSKIM